MAPFWFLHLLRCGLARVPLLGMRPCSWRHRLLAALGEHLALSVHLVHLGKVLSRARARLRAQEVFPVHPPVEAEAVELACPSRSWWLRVPVQARVWAVAGPVLEYHSLKGAALAPTQAWAWSWAWVLVGPPCRQRLLIVSALLPMHLDPDQGPLHLLDQPSHHGQQPWEDPRCSPCLRLHLHQSWSARLLGQGRAWARSTSCCRRRKAPSRRLRRSVQLQELQVSSFLAFRHLPHQAQPLHRL